MFISTIILAGLRIRKQAWGKCFAFSISVTPSRHRNGLDIISMQFMQIYTTHTGGWNCCWGYALL